MEKQKKQVFPTFWASVSAFGKAVCNSEVLEWRKEGGTLNGDYRYFEFHLELKWNRVHVFFDTSSVTSPF